jgi:hypothetical protein
MIKRLPKEATDVIGEGRHMGSTYLATPPTTMAMRAIDQGRYRYLERVTTGGEVPV